MWILPLATSLTEYLKCPENFSTYAVASEPANDFKGWPDCGLIWETAHPYFIFDKLQGATSSLAAKTLTMQKITLNQNIVKESGFTAEEIHENVSRDSISVCFLAWAGTFAETKDGLAVIGKTEKRTIRRTGLWRKRNHLQHDRGEIDSRSLRNAQPKIKTCFA